MGNSSKGEIYLLDKQLLLEIKKEEIEMIEEIEGIEGIERKEDSEVSEVEEKKEEVEKTEEDMEDLEEMMMIDIENQIHLFDLHNNI